MIAVVYSLYLIHTLSVSTVSHLQANGWQQRRPPAYGNHKRKS